MSAEIIADIERHPRTAHLGSSTNDSDFAEHHGASGALADACDDLLEHRLTDMLGAVQLDAELEAALAEVPAKEGEQLDIRLAE